MNSVLQHKKDRFVQFNHELRIRMLDKDGNLMRMVSQSQASRLLSHAVCQLVIVEEPTIQLLLEKNEWKDRFLHPNYKFGFLKKTGHWLPGSTKKLYGNYTVQSPEGCKMFCCNHTKILWYLNRNLLNIVSVDPPVFRFKFTPNGVGHVGDDYYLGEKHNHCVVCGKTGALSRHHVMPWVYRKYFPPELKRHNHHDILLLCLDCHNDYETIAGKLKQQICQELGFSTGETMIPHVERIKGIRAANALCKHGEKIPKERKAYLKEVVQQCFGKEEITPADLEEISKLELYSVPDGYKHYGQKVVELSDLQKLTERWRQHFLDTMKPAFLPEHWDVNRSIKKDKSIESKINPNQKQVSNA